MISIALLLVAASTRVTECDAMLVFIASAPVAGSVDHRCGRTKATVGFESLFRIDSASEGYLHALDVDAGQEFTQPREYTLTKIDGEWLIDDIAKGPLRSTSAPAP